MAEVPPEDDSAPPECQTCKEMENDPENHNWIIISDPDFITKATGGIEGMPKRKRQSLKKESIEQFLKYMNALMNAGHGTVFIHIENPRHLGLFDQATNQTLLKLIPDDTLFHENFERHIYDSNHTIFRIIPRVRSISTVEFKTKISTDHGLVDPTHGQMRCFLAKLCPRQSKKSDDHQKVDGSEMKAGSVTNQMGYAGKPKRIIFKEEEVQVEISPDNPNTTVVFHEDMRSQAKRMKLENQSKGKTRLVESLAEYCVEKSLDYISAFSKIPGGGSVYFGVYEDKEERRKWSEVTREGYKQHFDIQMKGSGFTVYRDTEDDADHYHIVCHGYDIPTTTMGKTGKFKCSGVDLTPYQKEEVRKIIIASIERNMKVVSAASFASVQPGGEASSEPQTSRDTDSTERIRISVRFHEIIKESTAVGKKESVVEVHVERYDGVFFTDPTGPLAYKFVSTEGQPSAVETFDTIHWICHNIKASTST